MFDKQQGIHCVLSIEHKQADREVVRSQIIRAIQATGLNFILNVMKRYGGFGVK